jgi:hypothetical protein
LKNRNYAGMDGRWRKIIEKSRHWQTS